MDGAHSISRNTQRNMSIMMLSNSYAKRLRDDVKSNPLEPREVRRVVGMGDLYMAFSGTTVDPEYIELYELIIDDVSYLFYSKLHP